MTATMPAAARMADRLNSLERNIQNLKRWLVALASVALAIIAYVSYTHTRSQVFREVRATRFTLLDDLGQTRGVWIAEGRGATTLSLHDEEGNERIAHGVGSGEVWTYYRDADHNKRLGLSVDQGNQPHVVLADPHARARLHLAVNLQGAPNLLLMAEDGSYPVGMGIDKEGRAWARPGSGLSPTETAAGGEPGKAK